MDDPVLGFEAEEMVDGVVEAEEAPCDSSEKCSAEAAEPIFVDGAVLNRKGVVDVIDEISMNSLASLWAEMRSIDVGDGMLKGYTEVS
jgi:hypothetical protein